MELMFLGTGSSIPTKDRSHPSVLLEHDGESLLFDCGEGTQRQFVLAKKSFMKVSKIFITHWHADHFAGLPTLLHSMHIDCRERAVEIYGPDAKKFVKAIMRIGYGKPSFRIKAIDVPSKGGIRRIFDNGKYSVFSCPSKHSVPSVAYLFAEKDTWNLDKDKLENFGLEGPQLKGLKERGYIKLGKRKLLLKDLARKKEGRRVVYTGDTKKSPAIAKLAKGCNVLIHDATFLEKEKYDHSSAGDAAFIAKKSQAKLLILTHFSSRYSSSSEHLREAGKVFPSVIAAKDFLSYTIA